MLLLAAHIDGHQQVIVTIYSLSLPAQKKRIIVSI